MTFYTANFLLIYLENNVHKSTFGCVVIINVNQGDSSTTGYIYCGVYFFFLTTYCAIFQNFPVSWCLNSTFVHTCKVNTVRARLYLPLEPVFKGAKLTSRTDS